MQEDPSKQIITCKLLQELSTYSQEALNVSVVRDWDWNLQHGRLKATSELMFYLFCIT